MQSIGRLLLLRRRPKKRGSLLKRLLLKLLLIKRMLLFKRLLLKLLLLLRRRNLLLPCWSLLNHLMLVHHLRFVIQGMITMLCFKMFKWRRRSLMCMWTLRS